LFVGHLGRCRSPGGVAFGLDAGSDARRKKREYHRVIKLRLRRMGAKKRPSYRIVAADSKSPRDGRFIEAFGLYDPITQPATVRIDDERARHWLSVGAQPTDTVRDLFVRAGLMPAPERQPRNAAVAEATAE
jgi:small subunit ribosomal protein S16